MDFSKFPFNILHGSKIAKRLVRMVEPFYLRVILRGFDP
jgi:hypothetical protein